MMPGFPNIFKSNTPTLKRLEIRLDSPNVYIPANADTNPQGDFSIGGRVVFMNDQDVMIVAVTLSLQIVRKIQWYTDAVNPQRIADKDIVASKEIHIFPTPPTPTCGGPHRILPGNHTWPFQMKLDGFPPETVSGSSSARLSTILTATIFRAGYLTKNLSVSRSLRVIRMIEPDEDEILKLKQIKTGVWEEGLRYEITAPPKSHRWGQPIDIDFKVSQISKGHRIEKIDVRFQEIMHLRAFQSRRELYNREVSDVCHLEALALDNRMLCLEDEDQEAKDHCFTFGISLPDSLRHCRQSMSEHQIRIEHQLAVDIHTSNENGETEVIPTKFPYILSIAPTTTFDENEKAYPDPLSSLRQGTQTLSDILSSPPCFGDHQKDPLYYPGMIPRTSDDEQTDATAGAMDPGHRVRLRTGPPPHIARLLGLSAFSRSSTPSSSHVQSVNSVPSYETAVAMPEAYTDFAEQRPSYTAR